MAKKVIKILLVTVGIIVLLIVALLASVPLWFGPVVKPVVNAAVPELTKTPFNLGQLSLNPYTGRIEIGDVFLANPVNYSEKTAVRIGRFVFDVEPASLVTDVIHIEEVTISDVFVSVVYDKKVMNFSQLQCNVTNSLKIAAAEEKDRGREEVGVDNGGQVVDRGRKEVEVDNGGQEEIEEISKKKVIIDQLSLTGLRINFGLLTLPVPPLKLTNIGASSNGATWAELWAQIVAAVMKSSGAVGDAFNTAGAKVLDVGNNALDTGKKTLKNTGDTLKKSGESLKDVGESLKGLFK